MTKKEIVDGIMETMPRQGGSNVANRLYIESVLEAFCDVAAAELLGGGEVPLKGIGKLKTVATKARKGRNPRTGEAIEIPRSRRIVVSAFRDFKEALRGDA